jgi:hypothetical protein
MSCQPCDALVVASTLETNQEHLNAFLPKTINQDLAGALNRER